MTEATGHLWEHSIYCGVRTGNICTCKEESVSDFDSLREDIAGIGKAITDHADAQGRMNVAIGTELGKLWDDNAELRDDLLAVANRVEALTAFVTSNPAEVAAAIVNDANRNTLREVRGDE